MQVPKYFAVIEKPITVLSLLEDLESWLADGEGAGSGLEGIGDARSVELVDGFAISVRRMWENCWSYNHEGTKVSYARPSLCLVVDRTVGSISIDRSFNRGSAMIRRGDLAATDRIYAGTSAK